MIRISGKRMTRAELVKVFYRFRQHGYIPEVTRDDGKKFTAVRLRKDGSVVVKTKSGKILIGTTGDHLVMEVSADDKVLAKGEIILLPIVRMPNQDHAWAALPFHDTWEAFNKKRKRR